MYNHNYIVSTPYPGTGVTFHQDFTSHITHTHTHTHTQTNTHTNTHTHTRHLPPTQQITIHHPSIVKQNVHVYTYICKWLWPRTQVSLRTPCGWQERRRSTTHQIATCLLLVHRIGHGPCAHRHACWSRHPWLDEPHCKIFFKWLYDTYTHIHVHTHLKISRCTQ